MGGPAKSRRASTRTPLLHPLQCKVTVANVPTSGVCTPGVSAEVGTGILQSAAKIRLTGFGGYELTTYTYIADNTKTPCTAANCCGSSSVANTPVQFAGVGVPSCNQQIALSTYLTAAGGATVTPSPSPSPTKRSGASAAAVSAAALSLALLVAAAIAQ